MAAAVVQDGDTVIVDCSDGRKSFCKIKLGRCAGVILGLLLARGQAQLTAEAACSSQAKLGKGHAVSLDPAVGRPYGSLFQLSGDGTSLRQAKR